MAQGDVVLFNAFLQDVGRGVHNLETGTIKLGLITEDTTPAASTAAPCWGAGGTTNLSTNEVSAGGNYSAGGPSIGGTYSQAAGLGTFDLTDVSIDQDASNPTNARWGIVYNDSAASKQCIGYVDLGGVIDLSDGNFQLKWNASGLFTVS